MRRSSVDPIFVAPRGSEHTIKFETARVPGRPLCTIPWSIQAGRGRLLLVLGRGAHKIGSIAKPDAIIVTADLPKTRSGKIMRRLLHDIAEGKALGDTTTLADPGVVRKLKEMYEEKEG